MFWKKQKPADIEQVKENIANQAFEKFLTPNRDYTVMANINGIKLVKKTVRYAYCNMVNGRIQAVFCVQTDKNVFYFQAQGKKITPIDAQLATTLYPQLLPQGPLFG